MSQCESVASTVSAQEDEDIEASNEEENPEDSEGTSSRACLWLLPPGGDVRLVT